MNEQRNKINFIGQSVFVGIDVHKKSWDVTAITAVGFKKSFRGPASATALLEFLKKHFPQGDYLAVYESGFSGFSTYYALSSLGIQCFIINAADLPGTQYERVMKTDRIDSGRLAEELRKSSGQIKGNIYVHTRENLDNRSLLRLRTTMRIQLNGYRSRVKHLLHCNGVEIPACFGGMDARWTSAFLAWLKGEEIKFLSPSRETLDWLLLEISHLRESVLELTRKIRQLSRSEKYSASCARLMTIPGVGLLTAMSILLEIEDPHRFKNEKQFASYLGLIPASHSSGEKVSNTEKTFRGNHHLGTMIIESAWIAIRHDAALACVFGKCCKRMPPTRAIVTVARKFSNRIRAVWIGIDDYIYDRC
jgi:transposase